MEGILTKKDQLNPYLNWTINLEGNELSIVKNHLSMSEVEKNKTIISAAKILSQCPNPNGPKSQRVGLAIGKVQSGKTSNFIALTALAFDNDYRIVIIFGGNTKVLLSQTEERISETFELDKRDDFRFATFSSSEKLNSEMLKNTYYARKNIIITGLKSYTHIRNIKKFIKDAGLADVPMLIIDDEGDQISLNGAVNKNEETTTYKNFRELITDMDFSSFISVTATPQANLLIDIFNILSPDFVELIEPGTFYSGFQTFHSQPYTKYISVIPDNENLILDPESGIPVSFEEAVSTFYVGSIIRKRRGDNSNHSMLIHPSQKIKDHSEVEKKLSRLLAQLKDNIESGEDSQKQHVLSFLKRGLNNLASTIDEVFMPEDIFDDFKYQLYDTSVQVLNGKGEGSVKEVNYKTNRNVIVLGGTMVERGLTIKNLTVTYIVRTNKGKENADTVEQRTRWFGYRINKYGSYLDLCRVFMTDTMAQNFYNLYKHENSIWANIIDYKSKGIPAKKMPLLFDLDEHFEPTRSNVVPSMSKFEFDVWKQQGRIGNFFEDYHYRDINIAFQKFLAEYKYYPLQAGNFVHHVYENVDFKKLYHEILHKYYSESNIDFDLDYVRAIISKMEAENVPTLINVMVMRVGVNEYHELFGDSVHNLMAGRSVNKSIDDPDYYKGDRFMIEGQCQLQLHNVKISKEPNSETFPMIAFYCPKIGNSRRMVGRSI